MVTRHFQNGLVLTVFLRYFKFSLVKVFKNLMLYLEYKVEQHTKKLRKFVG